MLAGALICGECGCRAEEDARGWQGHLVDSDDEGMEEEIVFFCPRCAAREFDGRLN